MIERDKYIKQPKMKLYHKNTDQLAKYGDVWHIEGVDYIYYGYSFILSIVFLQMKKNRQFKYGYDKKITTDCLNLEWR